MTYRQLLTAFRRAEELETEAENAREAYFQLDKRSPRPKRARIGTAEQLDEADAFYRAADAKLDEEISSL